MRGKFQNCWCVGMKSFDTDKTDNGEGKPLCTSTYLILFKKLRIKL